MGIVATKEGEEWNPWSGLGKRIRIASVITIVLASIIPISMIIMGACHLDKCPAEDMIAIYLIVMGIMILLRIAIRNAPIYIDKEDNKPHCVYRWCWAVNLVLILWFIVGCVYIYRTKDDFQSDYPKRKDYCDHSFYYYSFWLTTSLFILVGGTLVIGCFITVVLNDGSSPIPSFFGGDDD